MRHLKQTAIKLLPITFLAFILVSSCTSPPESNVQEDQTDITAAITEDTNSNPDMIYKLYKERSKGLRDQPVGLEMFDDFNEIYKANDVKVIGVWQNTEDPNEVYFMTAFQSEEHYQNFVAAVQEDSSYQAMGQKIEADRESIEVTTLTQIKP